MPPKKIDGDRSTSTSDSRASNCSLWLRVKRGQASAPGMIAASAAIIWQPLQTPSAKRVAAREEGRELVGELRVEEDRARPAFAGAERVAVAEAAAGDEALELSSRARPACRSVMCTSKVSKPAWAIA